MPISTEGTNNVNTEAIVKAIKEAMQNTSSSQLYRNAGYIGDVGTNPVFSASVADLAHQLDDATNELKEFVNNLRNSIIEKETRLAKIEEIKAAKSFSSTPEYEKRFNKLAEKEAKLDEKLRSGTISDEDYVKETNKIQKSVDNLEKTVLRALNKEKKQLTEEVEKEKESLNNPDGELLEKMQKRTRAEIEYNLEYQKEIKAKKQGLTLEERITEEAEKRGIMLGRVRNGYNEVKQAVSKIVGIAKDLIEPWAKLDTAAFNYAKSIGTSGQYAEKLRKSMIDINTEMNTAAKFGLTTADMFKYNSDYSGGIGRQVDFTGEQWNNIAGASKIFGENTQRMLQGMDIYGIGLGQATERMRDMFVTSEKTGVSLTTYSKNFLNNIKLAQNYNFKDGVNGMEAMAKRSTEIRLNMSEVARFADKVSTVEGALTTAANLSVLGGSFAAFSNPMQMLYEGLNDIEGLSERMENMFGSFVYFDEQKGNLDMSSFNKQRVKAASQAMGVNYNDMLDMAFAKGRRNEVAAQLRAAGIGESNEMYDLLMNKAQLNEKGEAYVSIAGQSYSLSDAAKNEDLISILKRSSDDEGKNIATIAETLLGWDDKMKGIEAGIEDHKAYLAEASGVGPAAKNMLSVLQEHTEIIADIQVGVALVQASIQALAIANGIGNMMGGFGGAFGGVGGKLGTATSKAAQFGAKALRGGLIGGSVALGGVGLGMLAKRSTDPNTKANLSYGSAILEGAGTGIAVGSLGGVWGAVGGAVVGGAAGLAMAHDSIETERYKSLLSQRAPGLSLNGEYTASELEEMYERPYNLSTPLISKLHSNEGFPTNREEIGARLDPGRVTVQKKFNGGTIDGFGTDTSDSNLTLLSRGEYVMPARQTSKPENKFILDSMRAGVSMMPNFLSDGRNNSLMSIAPRDNNLDIMSVNKGIGSNVGIGSPSTGIQSVKVDPININGTIKFDLGGYIKNIDANALLNNPMFLKNLSDIIMKNINKQTHFGFDKNTYHIKY